MYAVVDIETTGSRADFNRIIEVAIYIHDGSEITDHYHSLIQPDRKIPSFITSLTGIDNSMVEDAPRFEDIAREMLAFMEGHIFVAHNVNFDYSFLKYEFAKAGIAFQSKRLCTVRLGRKVFPGLPSYSLGKLCKSLDIPLEDRHRAAGDAHATAILLGMILEQDEGGHVEQALKHNSREATLPPNLPKEQFEQLPLGTGIYYFHDEHNKIIYVGKAKNIRKRIEGHFSSGSETKNKQRLFNSIHSLSYELCGNELIALIRETQEIKKHWPEFNRSQKTLSFSYGLYQYEDRQGYLRLSIHKITRMGDVPVQRFTSLGEARAFVLKLIRDHELCAKICGYQPAKQECYDYTLKMCKGACIGEEGHDSHNERLTAGLQQANEHQVSCLVLGKGREEGEKSAAWIRQGVLYGFTFIDEQDTLHNTLDVCDRIDPIKHIPEIDRLVYQYLETARNQEVIHLNPDGSQFIAS